MIALSLNKHGFVRIILMRGGYRPRRKREEPTLSTQVRREADIIPLHPVSRISHMETDATVRTILASLDDMKAEDVIDIDLNGKSSIADRMIIASGRVNRHVGAIADRIVEDLRAAGHGEVRIEGVPLCDWVLIDAGDVIVHLFRPEVRAFYNLEKMWSAARPSEIRPS
jgi:ribosome-associated protein